MPIRTQIRRVRDVTQLIKGVRGEASQDVHIAVIAEPNVEAELMRALGIAQAAATPVVVSVSSCESPREVDDCLQNADLALVLLSPGKTDEDLERMVKQANKAKSKLVIVTGSTIDDWLVDRLADVFKISGEDVLFVSLNDGHAVGKTLVPRILSKLHGKDVPLAAALPAFRDEVVQRIITHTANQNAVIGVAVFVPGADFPILTANQVKMILRMSAAYNQELSLKRLSEAAAVVASGFGLRLVAREVLGFIPVAGWAVKGAIAYGGTVAMGRLAKKYFEEALNPDGTLKVLENLREKGEPHEPVAADRKSITDGRETEPLH